jgi:hypothetical protein
MRRIHIEIGSLLVEAELDDTPVADAVWAALPIDVPFETWDGAYAVALAAVVPRWAVSTELPAGRIAYAVDSRSLLISWHRTLATEPLYLVGRVLDDPLPLADQSAEIMLRVIRAG